MKKLLLKRNMIEHEISINKAIKSPIAVDSYNPTSMYS